MKASIELAKWWTNLCISDKEHLANQPYPACSSWWISLTEKEQSDVMKASGIARVVRNRSICFT